MKKRTIVIALLAVAGAIAYIGTGYALFGQASYFLPGNASLRAVQLRSTSYLTDPNYYSGVDFGVAAGMTLSDLTNLATDYNFTQNSCGGGSPRFQINLTTPANGTKSIWVYIGPPPNYTGCAAGWLTSGNLVTPASLVDASPLGGSPYLAFASALTAYGTYPVTGIQLVADGGWASPPDYIQTVLVDNVLINDGTYNFEPDKDSCKNGGWISFTSAPGPFKNQGECVSYFATQ